MKRLTKSVFIIAVVLFFTETQIFAHPPKSVKLSYSGSNLSVEIEHSTLSLTKHYVNRVIIMVNGKTVNEYKYESQPEKKKFVYQYEISAVKGDKIKVIAECNIFGNKEIELTVE